MEGERRANSTSSAAEWPAVERAPRITPPHPQFADEGARVHFADYGHSSAGEELIGRGIGTPVGGRFAHSRTTSPSM